MTGMNKVTELAFLALVAAVLLALLFAAYNVLAPRLSLSALPVAAPVAAWTVFVVRQLWQLRRAAAPVP